MASQIISLTIVYSTHIQAQIKENIKAPRHWPLRGDISLKTKSIIYNSFIASNFNYCPLVWHSCGATNSNKLEKLRERSLRIVSNDLVLEVFKSVNKLNAGCLYDMFVLKEVLYDMRTPRLEQPIWSTTTYGLRSFSFIGAKFWNDFVSDFNDIGSMHIFELKTFS